MADKKKRYCILYTMVSRAAEALNFLQKYVPDECGEIFYPYMEYYRRDVKKS